MSPAEGRSVWSLLAASAAREPDRAAIVRLDHVTRYGELARKAARLASSLRELGVQRGDRVLLVLGVEPEYAVAYFGASKAGAVVVPVMSDQRARSFARLLATCEATAVVVAPAEVAALAPALDATPSLRAVIVTGPVRAERAGPARVPLVAWDDVTSGDAELDVPDVAPDDVAMMLFTSGTSGAPKGVMLSHGNVLSNTRAVIASLDLRAPDVAAMVLPFAYSYGSSVLHTHVAVGATLALVGTTAFPAAVLAGIERHRCTGLPGVPSTFAQLLRSGLLDKHDTSSLRYVTQAGAAMAPALGARVRAAFPNARLHVMYGQTEATARIACLPAEDFDRKPGSVGKAIAGTTIRIVDAEGREVPRGATGELVVDGPGVMLGYFRDAEETARALHGGVLHTGDLASMDEEGHVTLQGRRSEMIKSGAHRIAPQEIEAVLGELPEIAECAVTGVPDDVLGQAIVAFLIPAPGAAIDRRAVLAHCLAQLPRFKLPARVEIVDALPRTPSGKLQRWALAAAVAPVPPRK